jgi:undecaprenyl diphosphate synthase
MQSNSQSQGCARLHVAIIMDGNGRWATARGLPRTAGHYAGVAALRRAVECAPGLGIATLTVYAFSADNWRRPATEVATLMSILKSYLQKELARLVEAGVRLTAIGRRDRLPDGIAALIGHAETVSAHGSKLHLRIAIDYSGRDAILAAAAACGPGPLTREAFSRHLAGGVADPDVDLLIRTSGEKRLSDFLLWEAAYAELYFTDRLWPDFGADDLELALREFRVRDRRFGGLSSADTQPTDGDRSPLVAHTPALVAGRAIALDFHAAEVFRTRRRGDAEVFEDGISTMRPSTSSG